MNMDSQVATRGGVGGAARDARRQERLLVAGIAGAIVLTVFAGFAPTFYLRGVFGRPVLSPLLHVHGLIFSAWIVLLVAQVTLVASGRTALHRRLGVAGGALAVPMLIVGWLAAVDSARR